MKKRSIAILVAMAAVLGFLFLLPACCCIRGHPASAAAAPAPLPLIGTKPMPTPTEAEAKAPVQTMMRNVDFHVDAATILKIHSLRGILVPKTPGAPLNFDNKNDFTIVVDRAKIGMESASLDDLMNHDVFGYPNAPLRDLHIVMDGKQLRQDGIMHKIVDIPFTMWANVSADNGRIRLHPTKIRICGINGLGLLKAVGMTLEKMLPMPADRGVTADRNDLLLDPAKMLPPPKVVLHLVDAYVDGTELMQIYDAGRHLPDLQLPYPDEQNTMYYKGGTLRMGKLLMVDADMQVVGTDPSVPFDFYLDRYNDQLVAGFSRNQPDYGLVVFMRGFKDLGRPVRAGERLPPK